MDVDVDAKITNLQKQRQIARHRIRRYRKHLHKAAELSKGKRVRYENGVQYFQQQCKEFGEQIARLKRQEADQQHDAHQANQNLQDILSRG